MKYPRHIRYYTFTRKIGRSVFVLIPTLIRNFMKLENHDQITFVYDTKLKKITIRKVRK